MVCGLKWKTCACPWFNYEAVEEDRLAHMRVPVPAAGPGFIPGLIFDNDTHNPMPDNPFRPRIRRRDNNLADQIRALDLNGGPATPEPMEDYNYNFGVGNAAPHHMNETYVRPVPQARLTNAHNNRAPASKSNIQSPASEPAPTLTQCFAIKVTVLGLNVVTFFNISVNVVAYVPCPLGSKSNSGNNNNLLGCSTCEINTFNNLTAQVFPPNLGQG